jgi:hypothetical protein
MSGGDVTRWPQWIRHRATVLVAVLVLGVTATPITSTASVS